MFNSTFSIYTQNRVPLWHLDVKFSIVLSCKTGNLCFTNDENHVSIKETVAWSQILILKSVKNRCTFTQKFSVILAPTIDTSAKD